MKIPRRFDDLSIIAVLVLALTGSGYGLTLGEGVGWGGGDFASYVWNARNLLEGKPLGEAPFIPNYQANTGVTVVPPLFPLALAVPVALFGADLQVLKLFNIGFLLAFLFLAFKYARPQLQGVALLYLLVLAASPQLWAMRDALLSEYLFLALLMALLLTWDRLHAPNRCGSRRGQWALATFLAAGTILTRVVGVVLVPAVFFAGLWAERRLSLRTTAMTVAAAGAFAYLVFAVGIFEQYAPTFSRAAMDDAGQAPTRVEQSGGGLTDSVLDTLELIPERARFSIGQISVLWTRGIQDAPGAAEGWAGRYQRVVTAVLLILGAVGFVALALKRVSLAEWFTVGYGCMMLLVPAYLSSGRMYLPLAVMLLFYAFYATVVLGRRLRGRMAAAPPIALLCIVLVSEAVSLWAIDKRHLDQGSADPLAVAFFEEVRRIVPEDAVMIGYRPRGVAFFTDRTTTDYHQSTADAAFWERAARLGVSHMYFDSADPRSGPAAAAPGDAGTGVAGYATEFMGEAGARFQSVYENERFRLYKLEP